MDKLIFIDVDGTLTHGLSSWELVHHYFEQNVPGMVNEMNKNTKLWEDGKIDYNTWARLDVALWKGQKYTELEKALLPPNLINGAKEGISKLKENGLYTVLVSGGINIMVNEVKRLIGADEAYSNIICEDNGYITGEVKVPVGNSKVEVVDRVIQRMNIDRKNTFAIGDHINDKEMFEHCGYSLGINIKRSELKEYADKVIDTDNFEIAVDNIIENI